MKTPFRLIFGPLLCLFLTTNWSFAQADYNNHLKYWFYRWRLTNDFMHMGIDQGDGCIAGERNLFWNGDPNSSGGSENFVSFGDQTIYLGHYISVLATEYKLLANNQKQGDIERTKTELFYALFTYKRLDRNAELLYPFNNGQVNNTPGYFIRDDVPPDYLNPNINPTKFTHFNQSYTTYPNSPQISRNKSDHSDSGPPGGPGFIIQDPNQNSPSGDQYMVLLMGMRLIQRSLPNTPLQVKLLNGNIVTYNFVNDAKNIADDLIRWIRDGYFLSQLNPSPSLPWFVYKPDGTFSSPGAHALFSAFPIAQTGNFIGGYNTWLPYLGVPIGYHNYTSTSTRQILWNPQQFGVSSAPGAADTRALQLKLAAMSDSWRFPGSSLFGPLGVLFANNTEKAIFDKSINMHWASFYVPLWAYANNKTINTTISSVVFPEGKEMMDIAPCYGTNPIPPYYVQEWASSVKWDREVDLQEHPNPSVSATGFHPGLDYMLLHNLYYLTYGGQLPSYENHTYKVIDYPLTLTPPYTLNLQESFFSIEAKDKIPSTVNSTLRAGYEIHLTNGFHAETGTCTHIYTKPFSCFDDNNSGIYKNGEDQNFSNVYEYGFIKTPEVKHHSVLDYTKNHLQPLPEDDPTDIIVDDKLAFSLYPNPTNDGAYIETMTLDSKCTIEVKDLMGRLIASFNNQDCNRHYIDLSQEPSGIYLINIFNGSNIHTERLIKK